MLILTDLLHKFDVVFWSVVFRHSSQLQNTLFYNTRTKSSAQQNTNFIRSDIYKMNEIFWILKQLRTQMTMRRDQNQTILHQLPGNSNGLYSKVWRKDLKCLVLFLLYIKNCELRLAAVWLASFALFNRHYETIISFMDDADWTVDAFIESLMSRRKKDKLCVNLSRWRN